MIKALAAFIVIGIGCFLIFSGYGNEVEPTGKAITIFQPPSEDETNPGASIVGPNNPIRITPDIVVIDQGSMKGVTISFYNNEGEDVVATVRPILTCDGTHEFVMDSLGKLVRPGMVGEYQVNIRAPLEIVSGSYRCKMILSSAQTSFTIIVR